MFLAHAGHHQQQQQQQKINPDDVKVELEMEMEIRSWGEEACAERDLDPASVIGSHTGTLLTRVHST